MISISGPPTTVNRLQGGLLGFVTHQQVEIHPHQQHRHPSQAPLGGDVGDAVVGGDVIIALAEDPGSKANAGTDSIPNSPARLASRAASLTYDGPTLPYCRPYRDADPFGRAFGCVFADTDCLDVSGGVWLHRVEKQPLILAPVLDAG